MAQAQLLKNNCTSGEISPLLHQRSDLAQYQNGLETCLNAIVTPYGGVKRRYGTKFIYPAKHADKVCIVRKFEFSINQAYTLEIGEYYIRFFFNSGIVLTTYVAWVTTTHYYPGDLVTNGGNYYRCLVDHTSGTFSTDLAAGKWVATAGATDLVYEIVTPYTETELRELRFEQSADVLYIFHKSHHPAKLTRYDSDFWTLVDVPFTGGPFEDQNDILTFTMTPSAVTGGITITASSSKFVAGHIGSLWKLTSGKSITEVTASLSSATSSDVVSTGSETVEMEISGTWVATVVVERSFNNGTDWYPYQTISKNCIKKYSDTRDVQYRVTATAYTSGTVGVRLSVLDPDEIGMGVVRITAVASATSASATVINELRSTDATSIWAEPSWSGVKGYPRVGKIYEGRLVMASTDADIKGVWGSSSLEYENMLLGTNDDEAFYFSLDAKGGINEAMWMESWKQLSIGTIGGEIRLFSNNTITPSNPPEKKQDSDYGSCDIQGIVADKAIIFVDRCKRILREYMYDYNTDAFSSNSISVLSEHILNDGEGIVDIAYQKKQDSVIWCALTDGTLGALTYMPDQQVMGWHKHTLGGTGVEVESICVIPGTYGHDEVWMAVKRTINGNTVRYIELMYEDEHYGLAAFLETFPGELAGYDYNIDCNVDNYNYRCRKIAKSGNYIFASSSDGKIGIFSVDGDGELTYITELTDDIYAAAGIYNINGYLFTFKSRDGEAEDISDVYSIDGSDIARISRAYRGVASYCHSNGLYPDSITACGASHVAIRKSITQIEIYSMSVEGALTTLYTHTVSSPERVRMIHWDGYHLYTYSETADQSAIHRIKKYTVGETALSLVATSPDIRTDEVAALKSDANWIYAIQWAKTGAGYQTYPVEVWNKSLTTRVGYASVGAYDAYPDNGLLFTAGYSYIINADGSLTLNSSPCTQPAGDIENIGDFYIQGSPEVGTPQGVIINARTDVPIYDPYEIWELP